MFKTEIRPGIELRLLEERHSAAAYTLMDRDREYLREWLAFVDKTRSEEDWRKFIRASLEQFAATEGFTAGMWEGGNFMGVIGTRKIDWINGKVEIGYWIGRAFQGRGIVTDACRAVVDYLFRELRLNRVEMQCATGNARSAGIPRRLGFTLEGVRREAELVNGRFYDLLLFSMLKREWSLQVPPRIG
jgi:ribosomal-protein-serine acetyltransferase